MLLLQRLAKETLRSEEKQLLMLDATKRGIHICEHQKVTAQLLGLYQKFNL